METLLITKETPEEILKQKKKAILNFFNMNSLFFYTKNKRYQQIISQKHNINFPDSRIISTKLKIPQQRGPSFTRRFLLSKHSKIKKHFFIGPTNENIKKLSEVTKIPLKNLNSYNPPYIKELEFSEKEVKKISSLIKKANPDFVWVCVGSPKQDILANHLFKKHKCFYLTIGAAIDFLLGKKKESPEIFTKMGVEGIYRFFTDFSKNSWKKSWRSFFALNYLGGVRVR
ncbi:MAG: WecB/TagA/CpsF family glycosyltransferase [Candidatus Pacearchaeota archaeon]